MDYVKEYWAQVPFYNRALLIVLPLIYAFSWVSPIDEVGLNHYIYTVEKREGKV